MRYAFFSFLSSLNRAVLPMLWKRVELDKMSKVQMAIIGYKRWVTFNYLDERKKKGTSSNR
ncbi:MAG: SsrA-binding protein [Flavobacteriales bacterium]|nr:SsrA-binding protein [Flavobacteriales bacterium]